MVGVRMPQFWFHNIYLYNLLFTKQTIYEVYVTSVYTNIS